YLQNDPLDRLTYRFHGQSPLGPFQLDGQFQRARARFDGVVDLPRIAVNPALLRTIAAQLPEMAEHIRSLEGLGDARAELHYRPDEPTPFRHDVRVHLKSGKFRHPKLPLAEPLEEIDLTARLCDGRLTVERFSARAGAARLSGELETAPILDGPPPSG